MGFFDQFGHALLMAAGMAWKTGWTLVLGFAISATLQSVVSTQGMERRFGKAGLRQIALASVFGAASSSCSYASASIMRTLFKKGAALATALAFLFASTNLVIELGVILYLLMGWQFMLAEWLGGLVLIAVMSAIVALTYPQKLADEARKHPETGKGHDHHSMGVEGDNWKARLKKPEARISIARNFVMEWSMLWKDLLAGFLIGGLIAAFVPDSVWQALFLNGADEPVRTLGNVVIGPIVAMLTFVCSIGNVPLAAVLWAGGASFGGVIAFLYGDLIVLPLIDAYRRYFGLRMALYITGVLFASMAVAALVVDVGFSAAGLVPQASGDIRQQLTHFAIDYTFFLNILFGALALWLFAIAKRHPMQHHCH